jgi:hypothetical protein
MIVLYDFSPFINLNLDEAFKFGLAHRERRGTLV